MTRIARPYRGRAHSELFWQRAVAALLLAITGLFATAPLASAETRTLKLYYLHTKEKAEITYKRNGKYLPSGLKQLNQFLRDWRRNEPTKMDPRLFDIVWEVYRATGAKDYIHVVSAYRSPATNSMLRSRSRGVAKKSQHMLGKAMDFFIPGVKLASLRAAGLRAQGGGVGYYPRSGSPFVHLDVGNVRHWPRMSRSELAAVFPNGKTLHVPTDGKPLPGYEQALAAYKKRGGAAIAMASESGSKRSGGGFLSAFFGGGADDEEDSAPVMTRDGPVQGGGKRPTVAVASAAPAKPARPEIVDAPFPPAVDAPEAVAEEKPDAEQLVAALPLRDVPAPLFAPRPSVDVGPEPTAIPEVAAAVAVEQPAVEIVADGSIPAPMRRPDRTTILAAADPVAVSAMAETQGAGAGELAIESILAREEAARPDAGSGVPAPVFRPQAPVVLASLGGAPVDESASKAAEKADRQQTVAMLGAKPPAPRDAVRWQQAGTDPVAALASGVVTTPKSAKPVASDSRPQPRAVSVEPEEDVVRWALAEDEGKQASRKPDGKTFAVKSIRSTPTVVYTAGFQTASATPDANRFTGKAVTFMSVAKFRTN